MVKQIAHAMMDGSAKTIQTNRYMSPVELPETLVDPIFGQMPFHSASAFHGQRETAYLHYLSQSRYGNGVPAAFNFSTEASMSSTSICIWFQPPGLAS